ncbi:MAG: 16S rRNA (cytosine(1402)-N(4))-methyltransferase RsmH [Hyphomicrobiaceae bacterium]
MMAERQGTVSGDNGSGADASHIPVLLDEVVEALALKPDAAIIDGTFGAGGYTGAILAAAPGIQVVAIERDPTALAAGQKRVGEAVGRLRLVAGRFGDMAVIATEHHLAPLDGVVLDIGVSSMQLDTGARGFSFMVDGPLDMRMEQAGESAADVVNEAGEELLADIIFHYGEDRQARRIARRIVKERTAGRIESTSRLASIVERAVGRKPTDDRHPATRTFQALRIWVNDELGELARGLQGAERILAPGGRLVVVTFHSLEDRIVKRFLATRSGRRDQGSRHSPPTARDDSASPSFHLINQKPITPGQAELASNPRSRSAKLRVAVRTDAPAWQQDDARCLGLPPVRT